MYFNLKRPCKTCPFRTDKDFFLNVERAEEITDAVTRQQGTFACHNTTNEEGFDEDIGEYCPTGEEEHCAGVLIILEKLEQPNQMMRIAERLSLYDRSKLDMHAPVFDDFEDWIEHLKNLQQD